MTTAAFRLRRAAPGDLDALVDLENASFQADRLSRRQYAHHLRSASAVVIVATAGHNLLGSAVAFFRRGAQTGRLYSIAVGEAARGRGVGEALLAAVERSARRRGCQRIRLEVRPDNAAAIRLYQRHGYRRFGSLRAYYEDGTDAWRYEKPLRTAG